MKKLPYLLLLLLIAPQVFAGPFDPPPTDKSIELLGTIFGTSIGDLYLGGSSNPILSNIMEKFNFIIVVAGIFIVSYVTVLSTINTAQEGTAMGKKWSAVWIPIRSVIGMALLVPAPATGYSMIQVTVMWIILQGIGAADSLWNIALDGLKSGVSASAGTYNDSTIEVNAPGVVSQILNADICMQSLYLAASRPENIVAKNWVNQNGQYIKNFAIADKNMPTITGTAPNRVATMSGYSYFGLNNPSDPDAMQICGKLRVVGTVTESKDYLDAEQTPDSNLLKQQAQWIYYTKLSTISTILQILQPLAQGIAKGEYSVDIVSNNSSNPPPGGYRSAAEKAYQKTLSTLMVPKGGVFSGGQNNANYFGSVSFGGSGQANFNGIDFSNINSYEDFQAAADKAGQAIQSGMEDVGENIEAGIDTAGQALSGVGNIISDIGTGKFATITDNSETVQKAVKAGQANGWVSAGSFYFIFNRTLISTLFDSAKTDIITDPGNTIPSCGTLPTIGKNIGETACYKAIENGTGGAIPDYAGNNVSKKVASTIDLNYMALSLASGVFYLANDSLTSSKSLSLPSQGEGEKAGSAEAIMGVINSSGAKILEKMTSTMESIGHGDPMLAHSILGRDMMLIAESALMIIIASVLTTLGAAFTVGLLLPSLATAILGLTTLLLSIAAFMAPMIALLWSFGAILAIYCPLIPFMIFTMGVLGWILAVVEAMIGAPLIALGLVIPSGDELGKVEHALMILANIFLRPMLMIFGFLLAGRVYKAIVQLIDFGMADVFKTINVTTLFSSVMIVFLYVTFILSVTNTCFSLIYAVPDKILRWLGGPAETTDTGAVRETGEKAHRAADQIGGGVKEITSGAGAKASKANDAAFDNTASRSLFKGILGKDKKK